MIKARGFTLVEIMITVAIIAMLAAFAIPGLLRMKINANEAFAKATLKTISTACEVYAAANGGEYPTSIDVLVDSNPQYLTEDYTDGPRQGYIFSCLPMDSTGYNCNAVPVSNSTGRTTFTIATGGVATSY